MSNQIKYPSDNKVVFSVVIPYWNQLKLFSVCLDQLCKQSQKNFELVIIDNGSIEDPRGLLESTGLVYKYMRNAENLGFAIASNQGIRIATGRFILVLNTDAFLASEFLKAAEELFNEHLNIGMLAGQTLLHQDGNLQPIPCEGGLTLTKQFRKKYISNLEMEQKVFCSEGGAQIFRKTTLEEVKLQNGDYYDSSYFSFGEDTDLFLRAHIAGWQCLYSPTLKYWHIISASLLGKVRGYEKPLFFQFHTHKNRIATLLTSVPAGLIQRFIIYIVTAELGRFILYLSKRPSSLFPYLRAGFYILLHIPSIAKKRKRVLAQNKRAHQVLLDLICGNDYQ
jgi:GT2 family glycosyltransferase